MGCSKLPMGQMVALTSAARPIVDASLFLIGVKRLHPTHSPGEPSACRRTLGSRHALCNSPLVCTRCRSSSASEMFNGREKELVHPSACSPPTHFLSTALLGSIFSAQIHYSQLGQPLGGKDQGPPGRSFAPYKHIRGLMNKPSAPAT